MRLTGPPALQLCEVGMPGRCALSGWQAGPCKAPRGGLMGPTDGTFFRGSGRGRASYRGSQGPIPSVPRGSGGLSATCGLSLEAAVCHGVEEQDGSLGKGAPLLSPPLRTSVPPGPRPAFQGDSSRGRMCAPLRRPCALPEHFLTCTDGCGGLCPGPLWDPPLPAVCPVPDARQGRGAGVGGTTRRGARGQAFVLRSASRSSTTSHVFLCPFWVETSRSRVF